MNFGIFFADIKNAYKLKYGDWDGNLDRLFGHMLECGIDGISINVSEIEAEGEEKLISSIKKNGIKTYEIYVLARLLAKDDEAFNGALDKIRGAINTAVRFGCSNLLVVPSPKSDVESPEDKPRAKARMIEGLNILIKDAQRAGINLCFENFSTGVYPFSTIEDVEDILGGVDGLRYGYDMANFFCVDVECHAAYERLKNVISSFHVKNFTHNDTGKRVIVNDNGVAIYGERFDRGEMRIPELMRKMYRDGFGNIPWMIEYNVKVPFDEVRFTVELLKNCAK